MTPYHALLTALYATLPRWYARMQPAGSSTKYLTVHHPVTTRLAALHWQGTLTIAAPLTDRDGMSQVAAADLDSGGTAVIQAWLAAAGAIGAAAWGIATTGRHGHDGGHVWLLFDQAAAPAPLRTLMARIGHLAGHPSQELYPSAKALRLPFGRHTWTGSRGSLVLQDGQRFDLDDETQREGALATVLALPRNRSSTLPVPPVSVHSTSNVPRLPRRRGSVIDAYNQQTDLCALLQAYGATLAQQGPSGAVLRCPCPGHRHGDRRPSLQLKPATNPRYGRWIVVGYCPTCWLFTAQGEVVNAFDVFCRMEQLSPRAAVTRLVQQQAGSAR